MTAALVDALQPFVEECFLAYKGTTWRIGLGYESKSGIGNRNLRSLSDPTVLLSEIQSETLWVRAFAPHVPDRARAGDARRIASHLHELRNELYHHRESWTAVNTYSVVDSCLVLLANLGVATGSPRDDLERLRSDAAALVAGDRGPELDRAQIDYLAFVSEETAGVDLASVGLAADSGTARIRLADIYVPLRFSRWAGSSQEPVPEDAKRLPDDELGLASERETWNRLMNTGDPRPPAAMAGGSRRTDVEDVSAVEVLSHRRVVILGEVGAGKSTFLRNVARDLISDSDRAEPATPIRIEAGRLSRVLAKEPALSLRRYITQRLTERYGEFFESELELGRAVVLVDGLDEVDDGSDFSAVIEAIDMFCADYPAVRMVVTSRPIGFRRPLGHQFVVFQARRFDDAQIRVFVSKWLVATGRTDLEARELVSAITSSAEVKELATNPLLLTLIARLWKPGSSLTTNRLKLYQRATEMLVRDRPFERLGRSVDVDMMLGALGRVAEELIRSSRDTIGEAELLDMLSTGATADPNPDGIDRRSRAQEVLTSVEKGTGVLVEQGRVGGELHYGFLHRSFAEYLAARALADRWQSSNLDIGLYLHRRRWTAVIRLFYACVGSWGVGPVSRAVAELVDLGSPAEAYLHGNLRLALQLLGDGIRVDEHVRDDLVRRAFDAYLTPENEPFRVGLGRAIAQARSSQPLGPGEQRARTELDDDSVTAAKKARLRLMFEPQSPVYLRAALDGLHALLSQSLDPYLDVDEVLRSVGAAVGSMEERLVWAPSTARSAKTAVRLSDGRYQFIASTVWTKVDSSVAKLLSDAGVPVFTARDARDATEGQWRPTGPWLADRRSVDELTLAELVDLGGRGGFPGEVSGVWLDSHLNGIRSLRDDPGSVPVGVASFAQSWVNHQTASEEARVAAFELRHALIVDGRPSEQREALRLWVAELDDGLDRDDPYVDEILTWVGQQADPEFRTIVAAGAGRTGTVPLASLRTFVRALAFEDPDLGVQGAERRALLTASSYVGEPNWDGSPIGLLLGPEITFESPHEGSDWYPAGYQLASVITALDDDERTPGNRAALVSALRSIISVASEPEPLDDFDRVNGPGSWGPHPAFEVMLCEEAANERPATRAWAALILGRLKRAESADAVLGPLLGGVDPSPMIHAIAALSRPDLRDPRWLEGRIPNILDRAPVDSVETLGRRIRSICPLDPRRKLGEIVEIYLGENPDSVTGRILGALLLL